MVTKKITNSVIYVRSDEKVFAPSNYKGLSDGDDLSIAVALAVYIGMIILARHIVRGTFKVRRNSPDENRFAVFIHEAKNPISKTKSTKKTIRGRKSLSGKSPFSNSKLKNDSETMSKFCEGFQFKMVQPQKSDSSKKVSSQKINVSGKTVANTDNQSVQSTNGRSVQLSKTFKPVNASELEPVRALSNEGPETAQVKGFVIPQHPPLKLKKVISSKTPQAKSNVTSAALMKKSDK